MLLSRRSLLTSSWCVHVRPFRVSPPRVVIDRHRSTLADLTVEAVQKAIADDAYPVFLYDAYKHLVQQAVTDVHSQQDTDDNDTAAWIEDLRREYRWLSSMIDKDVPSA